MTNKPFKEFRDGLLKVTVWKNDRKASERSFFTFDLRRSYKDEAGNWHETGSMTGDDAVKGGNLLQLAYNHTLTAGTAAAGNAHNADPEADENGEIPY